MENQFVPTFNPADHPDARVQRLGFNRSDPYVEQCGDPVIGPSATLLPRRMSTLWAERVPAPVTHGELARSLGLGAGTGANKRLTHAIDRSVRSVFATWHEKRRSLDVILRTIGLERRRLDRPLEWTRRAHRYLDADLRQFTGLEQTAPQVAAITARPDRLQRPRTIQVATPIAPARAIER